MTTPVISTESGVVLSVAAQRAAGLQRLLEVVRSPRSTLPQLDALRQQAADQVMQQQFPTTRDEEWRFTDMSPLLTLALHAPPEQPILALDAIAPWVLSDAPVRLVFVDGAYAPSLSVVENLPASVTVGALSDLPQADDWVAQIAQQPDRDELFTALNTAGMTDVAVVSVPRNIAVATPIHLLFIVTGQQTLATTPRCLVIAESGSAVTVVEEFASLSQAAQFTNSVTEVSVDENAQVSHIRVQQENDATIHMGKTVVSQGRDARYIGHVVSLGGAIARHNLHIHQTGEQTDTQLNSLTYLAGQQLGDLHSAIALNHPHGRTNQLHKTVVGDRAHAVFNGKVFVPQPAQHTDAAQLNRNLLLSPKARVDTKPQLEIVADNVKCTHGATVGQLQADEVFYLQSRGIDAASARRLLVYAFACEVLEQIPVESLRQRLVQSISQAVA
ncbi:MAG: Fe-S cluster assembly protein SufD [Kaiparowitsia implicata GSE-PSE-MK54-09C]|nr:Fe-S cluster assembly protein SufD [Kaiparowitsia implicata GSE-PSE-MK54-09C]